MPLNTCKEAIKAVFKHFRQVDEISARICDCLEVECEVDGVKQKMADSVKLQTLTELMKCSPVPFVKRDKNSSPGMNFVMNSAVES